MAFKVLVVQVFLAGIALVSVVVGGCPRQILYPYGTERGDAVLTYGDDSCRSIEMNTNVNFYGDHYHTIYMTTNMLLTFGICDTEYEPRETSYDTPYAAAFWIDGRIYDDSPLKGMLYRKVDVSQELDVVAQVEKDSGAIGEQITPNLVFIGTWQNIEKFTHKGEEQNTLQVVLASDGNKTIVVFNYDKIEWFSRSGYNAGVQFDKGDSNTMVAYGISQQPEVQDIAEYSNINVPGRIVTRVDGDIQLLPLQKYPSSVCSLNRDSGDIITFDESDAFTLSGSDMKYLMSKSYQGDEDGQLDPCKYKLEVITDKTGSIDWVSYSVGVHPKQQNRYKRNFVFEHRGANLVDIRGHGLKLQTPIETFPYIEHIDDNDQNLTVIVDIYDEGWIVRSPTCQYTMVYNPVEYTDHLKLCLGSYYDGKTLGLCQNNNNNPADDTMLCSNPPEEGNPTEIVDSCSCPLRDHSCNKELIQL